MTNRFELEDYHYIASCLIEELELLSGKTILLLGGSGFLGTAFKKFFLYLNGHILQKPCHVISVDNYIKGTSAITDEIKNPHLESIFHNVILPLNEKLEGRKIDFIINCSGNASPKQYEKFPYETIDVSITGVKNLLDLAKVKGAKILNFSSSEVLGTPPDEEIPTSESSVSRLDAMNRRAPYDVSKLMIETLSFLAHERGVNCKIIRPFNIIGYFNKDDFRVIPNFFKKVFHDEKIEVYEPGTQTRTFCFYSDFIVGALKVLLKGESILYHIGNPNNEVSMIDLARKIANLFGKPKLIELVPAPLVYKTEPKRRCPSIEKAKLELGYRPHVDLDEMLVKIRKWAIKTY